MRSNSQLISALAPGLSPRQSCQRQTQNLFLKSSWKYRLRSVTVRRAVPGSIQSQWAVSCDPLCPEDRGKFLPQPPLRRPRLFQTVINFFPVNTPAAEGSEIRWIHYYWQQYVNITFSLFFSINYVAGDLYKRVSRLHETVYQQKSYRTYNNMY